MQKERRKGMYELANNSKIKDFTGIGSNFEIPKNYDLRVDTNGNNINESLQIIKDYLKTRSSSLVNHESVY